MTNKHKGAQAPKQQFVHLLGTCLQLGGFAATIFIGRHVDRQLSPLLVGFGIVLFVSAFKPYILPNEAFRLGTFAALIGGITAEVGLCWYAAVSSNVFQSGTAFAVVAGLALATLFAVLGIILDAVDRAEKPRPIQTHVSMF